MLKRLAWPAAILLVLMLSMAFRFNVEATKTYTNGVVKWERDRWTGRLWMKSYGSKASETIVGEGNAPWKHLWAVKKTWSDGTSVLVDRVGGMERQAYTYTWAGLVALNAVWLFYVWRKVGLRE